MVLESTVICVDNSEYMRNGDFVPTRLLAQQDAVNMVCTSKTRSNPENTVALMTMANLKVLSTLTTEVGKVMSSLHKLEPTGDVKFVTGLKIAHLALKHRQSKNHKTRIVVFVGSPVESDEKDIVKLAKKLKKEKVNVDIVSFGESEDNEVKLNAFINTLNGKDGTGSHLVTVSTGPTLSDALMSSPVIAGEDGAGAGSGGGFDFVDPNTDPELALALRVSLEEQRQRQEAENKDGAVAEEGGENMMQQAIDMSRESTPAAGAGGMVDLSNMSEEEQIALAMQMSMAGVDDEDEAGEEAEEYGEVMADPDFLQQVLSDLPGVDPSSEAVRSVIGNIQKNSTKNKKEDDDEDSGESSAKKPRKDDQ